MKKFQDIRYIFWTGDAPPLPPYIKVDYVTEETVLRGTEVMFELWNGSPNTTVHWVSQTENIDWIISFTDGSGYSAAFFKTDKSAGTYTIYAWDEVARIGTNTVTIHVTELAPPVPSPPTPPVPPDPVVDVVTVTGCTSSIVVGATCTLTATCADQFGGTITCGTTTWLSSNTSIATVSNGVVTGVSAGTSTITATASGKSGTKTVTVTTASCTTPTCSFTVA